MRILVAFVTIVVGASGMLFAQQPSPALKIVVIEGEGGVNIIQQKTAVRPLVEVRDRNNLPVAGATVTFTIGGGGQSAAFAAGAQTLTVTTNAAGQAAASGLSAVSNGAFQIQVQAAYQGQIATAAISQTNFATAAAAAQAGAGTGGTGGAAASGAAGGGGGISATTIGIVGAAVAGGAVAVTQVTGKDDGDGGGDEGTSFDGFNGALSGRIDILSRATNSQGQQSSCVFTRTLTGTIRFELGSGHATGRATANVSMTDVSVTGTCFISTTPTTFSVQRENALITGGPSALTFSAATALEPVVYTLSFTGGESGGTISGTLKIDVATRGGPNGGQSPNHEGTASIPVTLSR